LQDLVRRIEDPKGSAMNELRAVLELRQVVDELEARALFRIRDTTKVSWLRIGELYPITKAAAHKRAAGLWERFGLGQPGSVEYGEDPKGIWKGRSDG
jgi:hypothetical protein